MRALITGVTGQDGSYLAEFLLENGYEVYGLVRRSSLEKFDRIELCIDRINLVEGDLTDQSSLDSRDPGSPTPTRFTTSPRRVSCRRPGASLC